ncbi:MAG: YbhB/YbcL family Raf kinase inhibitor-like protein [Candidatus Moraniibacteriota bacterium]|nr:MAG: YbhB/YbcL family Raf kinase inhibitor-like protein [Candidatus Moranbacteria bacterium]
MERIAEKPPFRLHSPAFAYGERIPREYTCDGRDVSPPLSVESVPEDAESLALIVEDPDAPGGTWIHWRLWNIAPTTTLIREGSVPAGAIVGRNSFGQPCYGGPCPPNGEHAYIFRIYALRAPLHLPAEATELMFRNALLGNTIAEADLVGYYRRPIEGLKTGPGPGVAAC